jgi:SpoIID/LytB domain protein
LRTSVGVLVLASMLAAVDLEVRTTVEPGASGSSQSAGSVSHEIRIGFLRNGKYEVASLPMEPYVARVLAGEAARESPPAAHEALAIAIRTYAVANRGRHGVDGFDLCDQTHCQVVRTATAATQLAVARTEGQTLLFNGEPASIFYSASCGGRSERPSSVWPAAVDSPYLPVKPDDACEGRPEWSADLTLADLQRALQASGFRGTLRSLRIRSRNESGRVSRLSLEGLEPREISGQDLRMAVARTPSLPQVLSAAFEMSRTGDGYRFQGHGYGHGVGMCVIGSVNLAARGVSAADILQRYFPGTTISPNLSNTGVILSLPAADENARAGLLELARSSRDNLVTRLGVAAPARISVRVHASTTEYERATSRPWFTLGAVENGELHLAPMAQLRTRGMVERTMRRQLTRLLTEPVLSSRPLWVLEGVALYFGETDKAVAAVSGPCPRDDELTRPASPGALTDAYARALSCAERQLRDGRSWREVR